MKAKKLKFLVIGSLQAPLTGSKIRSRAISSMAEMKRICYSFKSWLKLYTHKNDTYRVGC